jgi:hypothetical protein
MKRIVLSTVTVLTTVFLLTGISSFAATCPFCGSTLEQRGYYESYDSGTEYAYYTEHETLLHEDCNYTKYVAYVGFNCNYHGTVSSGHHHYENHSSVHHSNQNKDYWT